MLFHLCGHNKLKERKLFEFPLRTLSVEYLSKSCPTTKILKDIGSSTISQFRLTTKVFHSSYKLFVENLSLESVDLSLESLGQIHSVGTRLIWIWIHFVHPSCDWSQSLSKCLSQVINGLLDHLFRGTVQSTRSFILKSHDTLKLQSIGSAV